VSGNKGSISKQRDLPRQAFVRSPLPAPFARARRKISPSLRTILRFAWPVNLSGMRCRDSVRTHSKPLKATPGRAMVRELKNVVERAVYRSASSLVTGNHLHPFERLDDTCDSFSRGKAGGETRIKISGGPKTLYETSCGEP